MRKFPINCKKGSLKLVLVALMLFCSAGKSYCATATWLGPVVLFIHTGGSGDWNTGGNWSTGAVPTAGDDVVINELLLGFTISLSNTANAKSITVNSTAGLLGGVTINTSGNALTVANSLNVGAVSVLLATSLTITGSGAVTLNNAINAYPSVNLTFNSGTNVTISSATVTSYNNSTINCGGTLTATASTFNISGNNCGIANTGTFNLGTASTINLTGTSAYVSNTGGTFTLLSDATGSATIGPISSGATGFSGQYSVQRFFTGGSTYSNGRWVYRNYRLVSSPVNAGLVSGNYPYTLNYIAASAIVSGAKSSFGTLGGNPTLYAYSEDYTPSNANYTGGNFKGITDISTLTSPYTLSITSNGSSKAMYVGNGFMFFFRGDKTHFIGTSPGKTTYPYVAPESVVFTATGFLNQGSYAVNNWQTGSGLLYTTVTTPSPGNAAIQGWNMVGNPYACTIDWETVNSGGITAVHVNPTIYILNPVTNQYNSYSSSTHVGSATTFSGKIASGEGFLAQANNTSPTLTFNESAKSPATQLTVAAGTLMMGMPAGQDITRKLLRLRLSIDSLNYDDMVIGFKSSASAKYNVMEDSKYLSGLSAPEGLASFSADSVPVALTVNFLSLPKQTEQIIRLKTTAINNGRLTLTRTQLDSLPKLYEIWLMDGYKNDSLDLRNNNAYAFDIDRNDTTSFGNNRFRIIIRQNKALGVHLLDFTAVKATDGVPITWKTENEENYTNFTVERSTDNGVTFDVLGGFVSNSQHEYTFLDASPVKTVDLYRLKLEDLNGAISYSNVITIVYDPSKQVIAGTTIDIYPNPAIGVINLAIKQQGPSATNLTGIQSLSKRSPASVQTMYTIKIVNVTGAIIKSATSPRPYWQGDVSDFLPGTYIIQVVNSKDKSLVGKTTFVKL